VIIDTSAIMAIALDEPERQGFIGAIADAQACRMSAGTWIELNVVITRRYPDKAMVIEAILRNAGIVIEPVTVEQAELGREAYRLFGQGTGHRARLNFGDCFAYALARATGEPLLFKGDDFIHTDVIAA